MSKKTDKLEALEAKVKDLEAKNERLSDKNKRLKVAASELRQFTVHRHTSKPITVVAHNVRSEGSPVPDSVTEMPDLKRQFVFYIYHYGTYDTKKRVVAMVPEETVEYINSILYREAEDEQA